MPGAHRADSVSHLEAVGVVVQVEIQVPGAQAMRALGARLAMVLRAGDVAVLTGDLGAGKTTLTQGIGAGLGVRELITSPTFVIARVHPSLVGGPDLVHVDAFRLSSLAEIDDLDLDASLADSVTVVEWGQGLMEGLAPQRLEVVIHRPRGDEFGGADVAPAAGDEPRTVQITGFGTRWEGVTLPTSAG